MGVSIEVEKLKEGLDRYFITDDFSVAYRELKADFSLGRAFTLIWESIEVIEKLANDMELVSAGDKKKEALVSWLDDAIKFTGFMKLLEVVDGKLIGAVIDGCIAFLNLRFGNDWVSKWSKYI